MQFEKYKNIVKNSAIPCMPLYPCYFSQICVIAEPEKRICIYGSIGYYQLHRVMQQQEQQHVEREDLCLY